jgi:Fe-S cluster assembly protein SufD
MLASLDARRIVIANGVLVPELSDLATLDKGLTVRSLAQALGSRDASIARLGEIVPSDDPALALNTAFMGDGVVIEVAPGAIIEHPIHLAFIFAADAPASVFPRSLVVAGKGARAMIVESHEGPAALDYQVNTALEIAVGEGAHVDHIKITGEGAAALHLSTLTAAVGAQARLNTFLFTLGGATVRNQMFLRFDGEGTVAGIRGASLLNGKQHADVTVVADHAVGNCTSRETFKAVLDGESRGVFQGKIIVRPKAQKTDARMASNALLLSETAEADNKPELEIFADDVQCGHGATAGALDENLLFYLRARGIPPKEAEALLIQAFVGDAVEGIEHAGLRDVLMEAVADWVKARG